MARQVRSPSLHFAKALSFSVCVQEKFRISASLCESFAREARNDLATDQSIFPIGSHASQHCAEVSVSKSS